jgi:uncharacterized membrane protein
LSPKLLGLLIGGLLPALLFGVAGAFSKTSGIAGMPVGPHMMFVGLAVTAVGGLFQLGLPGAIPSSWAIASSSLLGFFWATGMGLVLLGLARYQAPLSQLVPLYNMNTLVTVAIALVLFGEWKDANGIQLLVGAGLIIAGGVLVSRA